MDILNIKDTKMAKKKKIYRYGMRARPWGMGTFPKNDNIIGPDPENKRKESGFWDVILSAQPLSKREISDFELQDLNQEDMATKVNKIAKKVLSIETLETQNRDSADFHDLAVWDIKEALELAYKLGQNNGL